IERRYMLSRASHSLVSIDGREPKKSATVSLIRESVTERAYDLLFSDDSFPGIDLTRRVIYSVSGDYLVVIDHVRSPEEVTARQRWQLGTEVQATISRHRVEMTSGEHRAVLAYAGTATELTQVTGRQKPFDGWVSTGWKQKAPATAVTATKNGTSFRFITVIAAGTGVTPTSTTLRTSTHGLSLEVSTGRVTERIDIDHDSVSFTGSSEDDDEDTTASSPLTSSASGRPHHLDPDSRREMFALLTEVRASARTATVHERSVRAREVLAEARAKGLDGDIDLGATAAATDLRKTVRGRVDPKKIQPHRTALVNWDDDPRWRPTFYSMPVRHHGSELALEPVPQEPQIHTLDCGPLALPLAVHPAPGDVLTVLFQ